MLKSSLLQHSEHTYVKMSVQSGCHVYKYTSCNESGGPFYSKAADNTSYLSFAGKTEVVFYNWLVFLFTILSEHVYIASFPSTYYVRYTWRQSVSFHKCYTFLYNSCVSFSLYFQCTFLTTCKNSASQMCVHANGKNGLEIELRYIWHVRSLFCVYVILILSRIKWVIWMFVPIEVGIAFVVKTIRRLFVFPPLSSDIVRSMVHAKNKQCRKNVRLTLTYILRFYIKQTNGRVVVVYKSTKFTIS